MRYAVLVENVTQKIYLLRGQKVLLDVDLAALYNVKTKELNKAVKRNANRFPSDFMFKLNNSEVHALRFQIGTSNRKRGGTRYRPFVFTEQGVAMLSSVLKSKRAAYVNVAIMRAFVRLREMMVSSEEFGRKLHQLEQKLRLHDNRFRRHSHNMKIVFDAIRQLMVKDKTQIGFTTT
jgi:hypothetical protein